MTKKELKQIIRECVKECLKNQLNETEFYHATNKEHINSFIQNGIDITKAGTKHNGAGKLQGDGFYVYNDKKIAIHHGKVFEDDPNSVIVVIDTDLTPNNFDIDYEGSSILLRNFILHHWDYFFKHYKEFNMYHHVNGCPTPPSKTGVFRIHIPEKNIKTGTFNLSVIDRESDIAEATVLWELVQKLKHINKPLFDEFKNENLTKAKVLKYNGNTKIYPIRIEDLDGNILWKKQ